MVLRSFAFNLAVRILLLCLAAGGFTWALISGKGTQAMLALLVLAALSYVLYYYVNDTNRRLTRLFESVRYSDFAIRFSPGKHKSQSYEQVNRQFNEVLEAFRQARAEKETNLLFLNTIVQHLTTGLLAFDAQYNVLISNNTAFQLLNVYRLHHLNDLPERHHELHSFVRKLSSKGKLLYQPETNRQISVQGVLLNLQGRSVKLLTLQNIHPELQRKEVDAWRNLTRVLRHEMMNSITPIVSLVETAQDILKYDLPENESTADLNEALEVIAGRSRSLVNFVDAYRSFTAIPQPKLADFEVGVLLERVVQLAEKELKSAGIRWENRVQPENMTLNADAGQLEMILLNLLKNAREALENAAVADKFILLEAGIDGKQKPYIAVTDNGPGVSPELLEEIFIPFFTTKETGTGVGLSISKQIMQLHGGDIRVSSSAEKGTRFVLEF